MIYLVVDVLLIPCALSWRRSGVWLCRNHCQEAAALGLFGVGCVTFSVYVGGLESSLLGVPKLHFGTLRRTDFGTLCFFSFRGFRLVTSARCGGWFFARFEPGFRWCLAVLSPPLGGCRSGCVRARWRRVLWLRAGACFFSFRGFRLVTSARCGGWFFARFEPGFRWCLAVLNPSPGGCRSGCVRARWRRVFCLRAGACFFSFRGFRLVTSARCGGGFFARFEPGFRLFWVHRWAVAVLGVSGLGGVAFSVYVLGPVSSPLGGSDLSLRHAAGEGFLLGLSPDLGGVWLFWVHRREVAVLGVSGLGCVAFSVYVLGPVSSPLGVQTCHFGTLRGRVFC